MVPEASTTSAPLQQLQDRIAELERLVATDHLTGAWNRTHLDRVIGLEVARSASNRQPVSLVVADVDDFKSINDRFGHAVGDSVLRELVSVLNANIRSSDLLFRWGGDEFVILVSGGGYRGAERVAESVRSAIAAHDFTGAGTVRISAGVAEHVGSETPGAWFQRADAALYAAKQGGRNRIVVDRQGDSDTWAAAGQGALLHLTWLEGYESGNATIDAEHRELFRLANALMDATLAAERAPAACGAALDALLEHVGHHFADEEALLEEAQYDHLEGHRRAHAGLVRRALELKRLLHAGRASLGVVVEYLVQEVVAHHLMVVDRAFFPLFSGNKPAART
ncbi:MAG: bacteriohemerythrin [Gammaproteobacteria bacterium]|nr:bacteriohemerythrin [Gammaproteobacteria bacterium]